MEGGSSWSDCADECSEEVSRLEETHGVVGERELVIERLQRFVWREIEDPD